DVQQPADCIDVAHDVLAEDPGIAAGGADPSRDHGEQGGLAGRVRSQQPEDLALPDVEGDTAHHLDVAVLAAELPHDDRRRDGTQLGTPLYSVSCRSER